jgi:ribonucleoside-diphosphate reductase alpha chain
MRNAQSSVLAPTGTISFMMDCDTTGIEPDLALVKYKKLVGGGNMKIVNQGVSMALRHIGYSAEEVADIVAFVESNDTIEGAPHIKDKHLAIFDCSLVPHRGERSIAPMGHLKMMAACQPFLSGAISKTVNMPRESTVEDVKQMYMEAWEMGLKAIAIYRDGCKESQPLNVDVDDETTPRAVAAGELSRRAMPKDRMATVHKFGLNGHSGYLTLGYYPDGQIGELFLNVAKQGSTLGALLDAWATMFSIGIQYGIPVEKLIEKFKHTSFEPAGFTGNPDIPSASSILDYVVKMVELRMSATPAEPAAIVAKPSTEMSEGPVVSGPPCNNCGHMTVRAGTCHKCNNCGNTTGCG